MLEQVYIKLGLIEEDVAEQKRAEGEKNGWKAMSRPKRERTLRLLELLGLSIDDTISLIQG